MSVSRKGVRRGLRVAPRSRRAPAGVEPARRVCRAPTAAASLTRSLRARLSGERSPLPSALAVCREEPSQRNPQKRGLRQSWRCVRAQRAPPGSRLPRARAAAPRRKGSPAARAPVLTCVPPPCPREHPRPPGPAPSVCCRASETDAEEREPRRRERSGNPRSLGGTGAPGRAGFPLFASEPGGRRGRLCVALWVERLGAWIPSAAVETVREGVGGRGSQAGAGAQEAGPALEGPSGPGLRTFTRPEHPHRAPAAPAPGCASSPSCLCRQPVRCGCGCPTGG